MILFVLACGTSPVPRPASVPANIPHLRFIDEDVKLDGSTVLSWSELTDGEGKVHGLAERLGDQGLWLSIPSTVIWHDVQRLLSSALPAGPVHLSDLANPTAVGPLSHQTVGEVIVTCPNGPMKVVGIHQRLTLEINADDTSAWVDASVRFLPKVERQGQTVVANLFQDECWAPRPCEELGTSSAACSGGDPPNETVRVAGPVGCFLPIGKGFQGHTTWREELSPVLNTLGFAQGSDVLVTASEEVPYGAVLSVLAGLEKAGISPQIGLLRMGNRSGPPVCTIPTRDAAQLAVAGQAWYGQRSARVLTGGNASHE